MPVAMAVLLLAGGCCVHRQAVETPTEPPAESARRYSTANFNCAVAGTTVSGQVRVAEDSVIWVSVSKIVELGRAVATKDSVTVYAKVMGRCFRGTYDDVYRRFHYRTTYAELEAMVTSPDAEARLQALARRFGVEASIRLQPWREMKEVSFPLYVPSNVKLEIMN